MTDSYYKDLLALDAMIGAVPATAILTDLKNLLKAARANAVVVEKKVETVKTAYDALEADEKQNGIFSARMEQMLRILRMAGRGGQRSRLEKVFLFNEDGDLTGNTANNGHRKFIKALRQSLGTGKGDRDDKVAALQAASMDTGNSVEKFCDDLKVADPDVAGKFLIASALDALLPVAETNGLSEEAFMILKALREAIKTAGGGGQGDSYWPSTYVYSSSSSSSSSSSGGG